MKSYNIALDVRRILDFFEINKDFFLESIGLSRMQLNRLFKNEDKPSKATLEKIYGYIYNRGIDFNKGKESLFIDNKNSRLLLFHGTGVDIQGDIDTKHSTPPNDFGDGFYVGESLKQGATWVCDKDYASVYAFYFNGSGSKKVLFDVGRKWLYAILYYRNAFRNFEINEEVKNIIKEVESADIVVAPIADNQMFKTIDSFARREITDEACLHALSATNLGMQYVFKSDKACQKLEFIDRLYLCREEKEHYKKIKEGLDAEGVTKARLAITEYRREGKYFDEIFKRK